MYVVADDFFKYIGNGSVVYCLYDCDDIDGVKSLRKVYCNEYCSV